ncbi:MAG: SurA N-terminal domain-containing protein [Halioglobus sp.]
MLQDIRQSTKGTTAKVIIGLIVISFALFGIESILLGGGGGGIAEVNGEDISPAEVEQAVNTQRRQLIAMMGEALDPAMLDDQRLTASAVDSLIGRKLLMQSAAELGLTVSEQEIGTVVAGMTQFQLDGQFSPDVYKSVLSSAGYTPFSFKLGLQEDLVANQLRSGLGGSDFATPAEVALTARITQEQRDVRYLTIPIERFRADAQISEADIAAYYETNAARFQTPETVVLEYVEIVVDDFREPVSETELREQYELAQQDYQYQTENRVAHILLEQGADEDDAAYQERIDTVAQALAAGGDFAALAGEFSDDIGSAASGGDLGFSAGDAFPAEMEEAIATLEVDQISDPVATDAGIHFIVLLDRREGESVTFEEMRGELEQQVQLSEARAALLLSVESFRDLAFNAEDLSSPAQEIGKEVVVSEPISRNQAEGLFSNSKLLTAAYSEDVLEMGHNSEVIELTPEHFVALRVRTHNEPQAMPLVDVSEQIVMAIRDELGREAVENAAQEALAALRDGAGVEAFATAQSYEWQVELGADRRNTMLPQPVLQRAFGLPTPEGAPVYDYVMTNSGDAQVLELDRVTAGSAESLPDPQRELLGQRVTAESGNLVQQEFQQGLRADADITVL